MAGDTTTSDAPSCVDRRAHVFQRLQRQRAVGHQGRAGRPRPKDRGRAMPRSRREFRPVSDNANSGSTSPTVRACSTSCSIRNRSTACPRTWRSAGSSEPRNSIRHRESLSSSVMRRPHHHTIMRPIVRRRPVGFPVPGPDPSRTTLEGDIAFRPVQDDEAVAPPGRARARGAGACSRAPASVTRATPKALARADSRKTHHPRVGDQPAQQRQDLVAADHQDRSTEHEIRAGFLKRVPPSW